MPLFAGAIELTDIVVGPTPNPQLAKEAIERFLQESRIPYRVISNTAIPYRSW